MVRYHLQNLFRLICSSVTFSTANGAAPYARDPRFGSKDYPDYLTPPDYPTPLQSLRYLTSLSRVVPYLYLLLHPPGEFPSGGPVADRKESEKSRPSPPLCVRPYLPLPSPSSRAYFPFFRCVGRRSNPPLLLLFAIRVVDRYAELTRTQRKDKTRTNSTFPAAAASVAVAGASKDPKKGKVVQCRRGLASPPPSLGHRVAISAEDSLCRPLLFEAFSFAITHPVPCGGHLSFFFFLLRDRSTIHAQGWATDQTESHREVDLS